MKKIIFNIVVLILGFTFLNAQDCSIQYFTAKSASNVINIEWKTNTENSVSYFELERSQYPNYGFKSLEKIEDKGAGSVYKYEDKDALLKPSGGQTQIESQSTYYYRIKITFTNGNAIYSDVASVTPNVSGFIRTWGMIKEMFR